MDTTETTTQPVQGALVSEKQTTQSQTLVSEMRKQYDISGLGNSSLKPEDLLPFEQKQILTYWQRVSELESQNKDLALRVLELENKLEVQEVNFKNRVQQNYDDYKQISDIQLQKEKILRQEVQKLKDLKISCKLCAKVKQLDIQIQGVKTQAIQVDGIDLGIQSKIEDYSITKAQLLDKIHSRCDQMIEELKADKEKLRNKLENKEQEWLQMFKSIYNLSKKPDFHRELAEKLESIHRSVSESLDESPAMQSEDEQRDAELPQKEQQDKQDDIPNFDFDSVINSNMNESDKELKLLQQKTNDKINDDTIIKRIKILQANDRYQLAFNAIDTQQVSDTVCKTYSELKLDQFVQLLNELELLGLSTQSKFVDIGSGLGSCVLATALKVGCHSTGIEYFESKHKVALWLKQEYQSKFEQVLDNIELINENALNIELLKNHNFIYSYNATWPDSIMIKLCNELNKCNFKVLVWAKKQTYTLRYVEFIKRIKCKNQGGDIETFYIYKKTNNSQSINNAQQMDSIYVGYQPCFNQLPKIYSTGDDLTKFAVVRNHDDEGESEYDYIGSVQKSFERVGLNDCYEQENRVRGRNKQVPLQLGKRNKRSNSPELRRQERKMKKQQGIKLTLDEIRAEESEEIKKILKQHDVDIMSSEGWLERNFKDKNSNKEFEKLGTMFCDGILLPRLEQLFVTYNDYEAYLREMGIQVQKISVSHVQGLIYIRLEDSANTINEEFKLSVVAMINDLRKKVEAHNSEVSNENQISLDDVHIHQLDYTQDLIGFFVAFDIKKIHKILEELLGMPKADRNEYKSTLTCLQFLRKNIDGSKQLRFKVYNKWLQFLQSEQAKKLISMNLKSLLLGSNAFYQKHSKAMNEGITRLEFSAYFNSFKGQCDRMNVAIFRQDLDLALQQLNKIYSDINYQASFTDIWNTFFEQARSVFVIQEKTLTVVYAKNNINYTYTGQSVKIGNKKDVVSFIKRFAIPSAWSIAVNVINGEVNKLMKKGKRLMQIPIQSLNVVHQKKYDFPFDCDIFLYNLSNEEVQKIDLVLNNGDIFNLQRGISLQDRLSKNSVELNEGEIEQDVTEQAQRHKNREGRWICLKTEQFVDCKFIPKDSSGLVYQCSHCMKKIIRKGKNRLCLV